MVFECFLQETSNQSRDGLRLRSENTSCEAVGLSSSIWLSKRQLLNEHQREFAWQIDCLMNSRSLDANFAVKLHVRAVCEARLLATPVFISNLALNCYRTVKPLVFKQDPAFIRIRCLFKEIWYTCTQKPKKCPNKCVVHWRTVLGLQFGSRSSHTAHN